jgi:hypothetical protein
MEKFILLFDLFTIALISYQLFAVYLYCHSVDYKKDRRIWILSLCMYSTIFTFIHTGLINPESRPAFDYIIEFNRFAIMMSLCIYYITNASRILHNSKDYLKCIYIWTLICTLIYLALGINIFIEWGRQGANICRDPSFFAIELCNFSCVIIFAALYFRLNKKIGETTVYNK